MPDAGQRSKQDVHLWCGTVRCCILRQICQGCFGRMYSCCIALTNGKPNQGSHRCSNARLTCTGTRKPHTHHTPHQAHHINNTHHTVTWTSGRMHPEALWSNGNTTDTTGRLEVASGASVSAPTSATGGWAGGSTSGAAAWAGTSACGAEGGAAVAPRAGRSAGSGETAGGMDRSEAWSGALCSTGPSDAAGKRGRGD